MDWKKIGFTLESLCLRLGKSLSLLSDYEYHGRQLYLYAKWGLRPILVTEMVFPERTVSIDRLNFRKKEGKHHRCAVFAAFCQEGTIDEPLLFLLSELSKAVDTLIFVADSPIFPAEAEKLTPYVDYILCERHGELDFGSFKRGFEAAEKNGFLTDVEQLIFCNDSCIGPFRPFQDYFDRFSDADFSGMCLKEWGYKKVPKRIYLAEMPVLVSYFFAVSRKVFQSDYFRQFIHSIKKEQYKLDILINYEQRLTELLIDQGIQPQSWFSPRPKDSYLYNWSDAYWYETVTNGFILKKNIFLFPRLFSPFNETVTQTIFPFKIENGKLVKRSVK